MIYKGFKHSKESIEKMKLSQKGHLVSSETRSRISNTLKGNIPWNKGKKLGPNSIASQKLKGRIPWNKEKKYDQISGNKHWNWKGGINPVNDSIRKSLEMKIMSEACLKRDNYTCQECKKRGGTLDVHHVKPFSLFPELRFALDNLVTLCHSCHLKTPTYAGRSSKFYTHRINN